MGLIEGIATFLFLGMIIAFLATGILFFMAATNILNSADNLLRNVGAIAIPIGKAKKPLVGDDKPPC